MSVVDLEMYPYYLFVKMSKSKTYHDKCDCICKDTLIERLHAILQIPNFNKYKCYIVGRVNSNTPFPTFDCDMRLTHPEKNLDELKELFLKIKEKGFEKNINFDLKYYTDIEPWNIAAENPDNLHEINDVSPVYDISNNKWELFERNPNVKLRVRKEKHKKITYYKALLIKDENSTTYIPEAIKKLEDSVLPNSSEKDDERCIEYN